jgi:hypothetical protein
MKITLVFLFNKCGSFWLSFILSSFNLLQQIFLFWSSFCPFLLLKFMQLFVLYFYKDAIKRDRLERPFSIEKFYSWKIRSFIKSLLQVGVGKCQLEKWVHFALPNGLNFARLVYYAGIQKIFQAKNYNYVNIPCRALATWLLHLSSGVSCR